MKTQRALPFLAALLAFPTATAQAQIYLNDQNISVTLGASMAAEPFANSTTADALIRLIDAPAADSPEDHTQSTHIWVSGGILEVDFDFGIEYDLTTLHIWNYFGESFDVDNIDFTFSDAAGLPVGTLLGVSPALGGAGGNPIFAEDIPLSFPSKVRFVNAVISGSNGEVDFNNIGFTGQSSCGQASWENIGDGWTGTMGIPGLTLDGNPLLGTTVNVLVGNESNMMAETCLILGSQPVTTLSNFGGTLNIEIASVLPLGFVPPAGTSLSWAIPSDSSMCGLDMYAQTIQIDPGASNGIAFSRALHSVLGDI